MLRKYFVVYITSFYFIESKNFQCKRIKQSHVDLLNILLAFLKQNTAYSEARTYIKNILFLFYSFL